MEIKYNIGDLVYYTGESVIETLEPPTLIPVTIVDVRLFRLTEGISIPIYCIRSSDGRLKQWTLESNLK